jgi:hypothetical protein
MHPSKKDFRAIIIIMLRTAQSYNKTYLDINAASLHRFVGGYPNQNHRMPSCNDAMRSLLNDNDQILKVPKKLYGASLTIRYHLPRRIP